MSKKVFVAVVGIDYSSHSERALRAAFELARQHTAAELHVTHVAPAIDIGDGAYLGTAPLSLSELKDQLVEYLSALSRKSNGALDGVRVVPHVLAGKPMLELARLASDFEADLIVVGSHGRSGVARGLLGSVAEGVMRQATCPVLIVPPEPEALEVPSIEPPCPHCVEERRASAGRELWCQQHREKHGLRHTYHQSDRVGAETNMPLVMR
jgi:nucleotide-binding universal stress UspA family protein